MRLLLWLVLLVNLALGVGLGMTGLPKRVESGIYGDTCGLVRELHAAGAIEVDLEAMKPFRELQSSGEIVTYIGQRVYKSANRRTAPVTLGLIALAIANAVCIGLALFVGRFGAAGMADTAASGTNAA
jgi:hypothetical protein